MTKNTKAALLGFGFGCVAAYFGGAMLGVGVAVIMFATNAAEAGAPVVASGAPAPDPLWALRTEAPVDDQTRVH